MELSDIVQLPVYSDDVSYLAYPLVIRDPRKFPRRKIMREFEQRGVEVRPIFGCIPRQQPAYKYLYEAYSGKLPNAEYVGGNGFYIGCHQYLNDDDLDYIVKVFKEVLQH